MHAPPPAGDEPPRPTSQDAATLRRVGIAVGVLLAFVLGGVLLMWALRADDEPGLLETGPVAGTTAASTGATASTPEQSCNTNGFLFLLVVDQSGLEAAVIATRERFGAGAFFTGLTQIGSNYLAATFQIGSNRAGAEARAEISQLCADPQVQQEVEAAG
ncbi:MAG: hypothetical protein WD556_07645 [Actinomycetota bacterium]